MKLKNLKAWFKKNHKETVNEEVICKNCETQFRGNFCPECGQSVKDFDKPFSFIFYNFVGDFFAFDTRFFRTFGALLVKPGFLTKEYFEGKRIRYTPPFRIFIFASFILFLLLQIYTNRGLTSVLDSSLDNNKIGIDSVSLALADSVIKDINIEIDSSFTSASDSVLSTMGIVVDSVSKNNLNFKINMDTFRDTRDLRQALNKFANAMEKDLESVTGLKEKAKKREYIRFCRSPEQALTKILEYMSWAFFMLLPIFALILKLVYIRRKQYYMRHLIFSIHIHSFIFIVLILITGLYMSVNGIINGLKLDFNGSIEGITTTIMLSIPIYLIIALKKFYGQKLGKVILKFFAISILYNAIFWIIVGFVFLNALSII